MAANNAGSAEAGRKFGIPRNRIDQWRHEARKQAGPTSPRPPDSHPRVVAPDRPNLTILPQPPEPKAALPPDLTVLAEAVVKLSLVTMIQRLKEGDASVADCARALASVTDRLAVFAAATAARAEAARTAAEHLPEAEYLERLQVGAEKMVDAHLETFVQVYLDRRGLRLTEAATG